MKNTEEEKTRTYRGSRRINAGCKKQNLTTETRRTAKIGKPRFLTTKDTKEHGGKTKRSERESKKPTAEGGCAT
jgi:hypothetical protein